MLKHVKGLLHRLRTEVVPRRCTMRDYVPLICSGIGKLFQAVNILRVCWNLHPYYSTFSLYCLMEVAIANRETNGHDCV